MNIDFNLDPFKNFLIPYFSPALKLSNQGRCSGGVIVLVKTFLKDYVSEVKQVIPNCITLRLTNLFHKELICIFPYIACASSPFYNNYEEKNGILILENHISKLLKFNDSSFLIIGDLNSRSANIQPLDECSIASKFTDDINNLSFFDYSLSAFARHSKDTTLNAFGKSLIELCASFNFVILNGFCRGDQEGEFTFISPNGNSVIDYCIISEDLLSCDMFLKVEERIESWHLPLSLDIEFLSNTLITCEPTVSHCEYYKPKWLNENIDYFESEWLNNDCSINIASLIDIVKKNPDYTTDCISAFSELLVNSAHMMSKPIFVNSKPKVRNSWFDLDCLSFKRQVRRNLRKYRSSGLSSHKINYICSRNSYKSFLKIKKRNYSVKKSSYLLQNLKNSKLFWNEINNICPKQYAVSNITLDMWFNHFKNIFRQRDINPPICSENLVCNLPTDYNASYNMNSPFSLFEINRAIRICKTGKAPGPDNILNELFKHKHLDCIDFILTAFNSIFESHDFPFEWSHANIIPVHKKGDFNSCDNFRPIWLTSLFSKLYTHVLNKRVSDFVTANCIIPEEQAGFREGYSTIDHIFTLYSMIQLQFSKNKKLYVCFVDYKKAFDSINRNALFKILEANGINGNMLNAIMSIYKNVSASVFVNGNHSDKLFSLTGLKQGCLLSPNLFSIFMTEISKALNSHGIKGIKFEFNTIFHLLFADDIILVSDSIKGLQNQLNILEFQSNRLGLEINNDKTQIVIFRKGGFVSKSEKWFYGNKELKIVNSYRYLGVEFSTKLSFKNAVRPFISKAKKACYDISSSLNNVDCYSLDVFSKLFDSKVLPILSYACELWGMNDMIEVERVHTNAFKRFLNVSVHCSNITLYADSGRLPLCISFKLKCVKYWLRLIDLDDKRISKQAYHSLLLSSEQGSRNWVTNIKDILEQNGFGIVWLFKGVGNKLLFLNEFKLRLIDCYKQSWHAKISSSDHFSVFYSFKSIIMKESFLSDNNFDRHFRNILVRFRLGVSKINCHRYKFYTNPNLLKCPVCNATRESEYHVIFECNGYKDIRKKLPANIVDKRSVESLSKLFNSKEYNKCLAKFLFEMFQRRNDYLV